MSAEAVGKHEEQGWGTYYVVFNALIFLTVVTVAISYFDLGAIITALVPRLEIGHGANIFLGLVVAVIKASLVVWFFMHQKYEEGVNRFAFGFCISLFLMVLVAFTFDFVWLGTYVVENLAGAAVGGH